MTQATADPGAPYDPLDADHHADPAPRLAAARARCPVSQPRPGMFVIARHDDVRTVLAAPREFSSKENFLLPDGTDIAPVPAEMITMLDPPEHTALRARLRHWFTPARLRALEPRIREIVAGVLDGLAPGQRIEAFATLARPVPARIVYALRRQVPAHPRDRRIPAARLPAPLRAAHRYSRAAGRRLPGAGRQPARAQPAVRQLGRAGVGTQRRPVRPRPPVRTGREPGLRLRHPRLPGRAAGQARGADCNRGAAGPVPRPAAGSGLCSRGRARVHDPSATPPRCGPVRTSHITFAGTGRPRPVPAEGGLMYRYPTHGLPASQ